MICPGRIDRLDELLVTLSSECEKIGRDPRDIEITTGTSDMTVDNIKALADKGVSRLVIPPPGRDADDIRKGLDSFADKVIANL